MRTKLMNVERDTNGRVNRKWVIFGSNMACQYGFILYIYMLCCMQGVYGNA